MLNKFIDWAQRVASERATGIQVAIVTVGAESDNRAARLDIDTAESVARITCWESGDFDAEILELKTDRQIYLRRGVLDVHESLSRQFQPLFDALGVQGKDIGVESS